MLNEWGPTELYDAEAERNAMYCDACGGYHDGPCPREDEDEDEEREVTSIEIICDQYAGERHWYMPDLDGDNPPHATNIRVVRESESYMQGRTFYRV